ncbi:PspA-associated protein PspAA [Sediminivirga luteola]|jgi:hypothetical protein|uniref:PspA-associated domain-containing protein n=1 Tax=Sediminivirga luteola TaxID=1774748 RepID=A0A8J2XIH4_9MICO|nr:hypothetical protein [Sediminivirga luteola]MCI2265960.1 hypothetical protein [Sediminivirga luteola]GGA03524.1 hypothetical protein GCM10011333_02830 [Sediminivirga luteola]
MIVRILGEGQFNIADIEQEALQRFDDDIETAVASGDEERVHSSLVALRDFIVTHGEPVADDYLGPSDVVVPFPDADISDIQGLLNEEGLIPDF